MAPPRQLKFRIRDALHRDTNRRILAPDRSSPQNARAPGVVVGSDDSDRLPMMLANTPQSNLSFFFGRVHDCAGLAEIYSGRVLSPVGPLKIDTGHRRDRLSPVRFFRKTEQNPLRNSLFQQCHGSGNTGLLSDDGTLEHDRRVHAGWHLAGGHQQIGTPEHPDKCNQNQTKEEPHQGTEWTAGECGHGIELQARSQGRRLAYTRAEANRSYHGEVRIAFRRSGASSIQRPSGKSDERVRHRIFDVSRTGSAGAPNSSVLARLRAVRSESIRIRQSDDLAQPAWLAGNERE